MISTLAVDFETAMPSPELAAALVASEFAGSDFEQQLAVVGAWERIISWATACQAECLVAIDLSEDERRYNWHAADAARSLADQLGLVLGVSGGSAARRMVTADRLVRALPAVQDALRVGAITTHHARVAAAGAGVLDVAVAQEVAAVVMVADDWRTPSQFADTFARIVHELDPDGAEERHRARRRDRRLSHRPEPDGMGSLWALLPAEDSQAVFQRCDDHARTSMATNTVGDDRTLEHRRVDALVELVCGPRTPLTVDPVDGSTPTPTPTPTINPAPTPWRGGRGPRIHVTVSMSTLIGATNTPAYLAGYGWVDAATARRIAADPTATWHRLLVDPASGRLLDYGRTVYRPPQDLRDFVVARDRTCIFPTCDLAAMSCDLDHHEDWADGGPTCERCLHALCRRHHKLRHEGGWSYSREPDTGDVHWVDPAGTVHHRPVTTLPTPGPVAPPTVHEPESGPAAVATAVDPVDPPF